MRKVIWRKLFAILPKQEHGWILRQYNDDPKLKMLWLKRIYHCKVTDGVGCVHNYYYDLENGLMEMLRGTHE